MSHPLDRTVALFAPRRRMLWGLPLGLVALQGCGGSAAAATAQADTPAPSPAPTPAPSPSPSPTPGALGATRISGWAARPAASASAGLAILVPDLGATGSIWFSNGTQWVPASNPLALAHKFSNARMDASVGANADVLLDSYTIPAYVLGPTSSLRITAAYSLSGGTANRAPQVRAYFGTSTYAASYAALLDTRGQFTSQKTVVLNVTLQNCNALAANQVRTYDYGIGASINAFSASAIDFSQDVTIGFGALNNSTSLSSDDQQVLEWFSIEMFT